jgi:Tfp pilus assembly protein FimT
MHTLSTIALCTLLLSPNLYAETNSATLETQAAERVTEFATTLKSALGAAIKQGGLVEGINVCKMQAPAISDSLSTDGWTVARKSTKNRNPNNKPDDWEAEKIAQLVDMIRNSESIDNVTFSTNKDGQFRFAKAIKVAPVCLNCHGQTIAPEVKQVLSEHYPHDLATGYRLGDLRGIFSITKTLETSEP